jgi:gliding motility-associated-like protein
MLMRFLLLLLAVLPLHLLAQDECDVDVVTTPITCAGAEDGAIQVLTISGGPFVYSWNGGPPGPDSELIGLGPGLVNLIVADPVALCISSFDIDLVEPGIEVIGNFSYCPSDPPVITALPVGGYEPLFYAWSTEDTTGTLAFEPGTEGTFTINSIDADGCIADVEFELTELPSPTVVMGLPDTACQNVLIQVLTLATTADSIVWRWAPDGFSNEFNHQIVYDASGYQLVSAQGFDADGCGGLPVLDSIYINAQVPAVFTATQAPCTTELDILLGSFADSCAFFFGDSLYFDLCNGFVRFDARRYEPATFTLYATQANGCNDTLEVIVDMRTEPTLFLSNAFSPDGDGINERWPERVELSDLGFEIVVYDRWGRPVWTSTKPELQWDGTLDGNLLPVGVYAYTMRYRDPCQATDEVATKGHVTIVR